MWKICENQKIVEKIVAEISGQIGGENRSCNQLRTQSKNHGGKSIKKIRAKIERKKTVHLFVQNKQKNQYENWQNIYKETAKYWQNNQWKNRHLSTLFVSTLSLSTLSLSTLSLSTLSLSTSRVLNLAMLQF